MMPLLPSSSAEGAGASPPRWPSAWSVSQRPRPDHVGILAIEVTFPCTYIRAEDLESFDGVPPGKYTAGLGQQGISFCGEREDAISLALGAFSRLLSRHGIPIESVGYLAVGSESGPDRAKSIKSHLASLLGPRGGDVEGADHVQACHGATSALLAAAAWVESSSWDGRYAVVVGADVAAYGRGPARPTSGAGAAAMLVGPDAPLVLDPVARGAHCAHAYDFYKPAGIFPTVDGPLSVWCYLGALDACWKRLGDRVEREATREGVWGKAPPVPPTAATVRDRERGASGDAGERERGRGLSNAATTDSGWWESGVSSLLSTGADDKEIRAGGGAGAGAGAAVPPSFSPLLLAPRLRPRLRDFDHALFHSPYNKLVRKAYARLAYLDAVEAGDVLPGSGDGHVAEGGGEGGGATGKGGAGMGAAEAAGGHAPSPETGAAAAENGGAPRAAWRAVPDAASTTDVPALAARMEGAIKAAPDGKGDGSDQQADGEAGRVAVVPDADPIAPSAADPSAARPPSPRPAPPPTPPAGSPASAAAALAPCGGGGASPRPGASPLPASQIPRDLERQLVSATAASFEARVRPSTCVQRLCGNAYAASVWTGLAQLVETRGENLEGSRTLLFSYGSGLSATMLCLHGRRPSLPEHRLRFSLATLRAASDIAIRLAKRSARGGDEFSRALERAAGLDGKADYVPTTPELDSLEPGSYYLDRVDERYRRTYCKVE